MFDAICREMDEQKGTARRRVIGLSQDRGPSLLPGVGNERELGWTGRWCFQNKRQEYGGAYLEAGGFVWTAWNCFNAHGRLDHNFYLKDGRLRFLTSDFAVERNVLVERPHVGVEFDGRYQGRRFSRVHGLLIEKGVDATAVRFNGGYLDGRAGGVGRGKPRFGCHVLDRRYEFHGSRVPFESGSVREDIGSERRKTSDDVND